MSKSYQRGNFLVNEIDLQAKLLPNKIGEVIQDKFVKEINRLVNEGVRSCCEGCEVDDRLSQLHHECMMTGSGRTMASALSKGEKSYRTRQTMEKNTNCGYG